ncbi:ISOC2 protein, partial [Gymnorhina tibicen]|nr:ISOC2 protein [Gymnorhina tibicen]
LPQGCRILGVPVLVTEQRPDVLGPTVPELGVQDLPRVPKTAFSMVGAAGPLLGDPKIRSVLLCGIEAQACILQTALDLLERGLDVHVVVDACSSRRFGAIWGVLGNFGGIWSLGGGFGRAVFGGFWGILPLIKEPSPDTGLILGGPLGVLGGP